MLFSSLQSKVNARVLSALFLIMVFCAPASADPINGLTYTYDLSVPDGSPETGGTGLLTTPHPDANDTDDSSDLAAVTSLGILTDGDLGSLLIPTGGLAVFPNGSYAGFVNNGNGGATQPRINVDLGGSFVIDSFQLHYLIEDPSSIYAPQPIPDGSGGNLFDALTVSGSTDGVNFSPLGSSNDFTPVFGLDGDFGSGLTEVRTATIALGGSTATHLSIDVHTPYSFIFLSEIVVDGSASMGLAGDFDLDGDVDGNDFLVWQRGFGASYDVGDLGDWQDNYGLPGISPTLSAIPEPATGLLLVMSVLASVRRPSRSLFSSL